MPVNIDIKHVQRYSKLELLAKQVVEGFITGLHKSPFHGFSVEFAEHRTYNTGESTRHIDWKLFGRTEKLYVKRYEEETNLRCRVVIDNSSSMYYPEAKKYDAENPNKILFSVYAAAAITQLLRKQRDAVGLTVFNEKIDHHTEAKSTVAHEKLIFNLLEQTINTTEVQKKSDAVSAITMLAQSLHKRSLVVFFTDMFDTTSNNDDLFAALRHLKHNKHEIIIFHVVDKKSELDFDFENRPYKFIDLESGEEIKAHPSQVKEMYLEQMQKFEKELKLKCSQFQIDFVEVDVAKGFHQVLLPYMIKRQKMS